MTTITHDSLQRNVEPVVWHALSAPYRREFKARDLFAAENIECFLPLRKVLTVLPSGAKKWVVRPVVSNMIFARASRSEIRRFKEMHGVVQYLTRPVDGRNVPITVPDSEMDSFRKAVERAGDSNIYMRPEEVDLSKGQRVRVCSGALEGCEGVFMKVKGARNRRLVIMLDGSVALAAEVGPEAVEVI